MLQLNRQRLCSALGLFTVSCFIAACTTVDQPQSASTNPQSEAIARSIASEITQEDVRQQLADLVNSGNPEAYVTQRLDTLITTYLAAEKFKNIFDEKLFQLVTEKQAHPWKEVHLLRRESILYSKLLTAGLLKKKEEDLMVSMFLALMTAEYQWAGRSMKLPQTLTPTQAAAGLAAFYHKFRTNFAVEKLALYDVYLRVKEVHSIFEDLLHMKAAHPDVDNLAHQTDSTLQSEPLVEQTKRPEVQQEIRDRANNVDLNSGEIGEALRTAAPQIEEALKTQDRQPQAEATKPQPQKQIIQPSTGPEGNITGMTFPPGAWALTFDDGPHPTYTKQILQNLADNGMPATFFELAQNVKQYPGAAALVVNAGDTTLPHPMALGNHSFSHPQVPRLGPAGIHHEIAEANEVLTAAWDKDLKDYQSVSKTKDTRKDLKPRFFRLPYGAGTKNTTIRNLLKELGMVHVFWNVDSLDWQDHNPQTVFARTQKQMILEGRGIVLFHDIHGQTVQASNLIMKWMKTQPKLYAVTIPEIVARINCPAAADNKDSEKKSEKNSPRCNGVWNPFPDGVNSP